jgi:hypothetical protein
MQDIGAGQQVVLAKDLSAPDIETIVRHHSVYGLISVEEVGRRREKVSPLVYALGRSVPLQKMHDQIRINESILIRQGKESRELAAVQTNDFLEKKLQEYQLPDRVVGMDFEVIEEKRDAATNLTPEISEGIHVTRSEPSDDKPKQGRPASRRANRRRSAA